MVYVMNVLLFMIHKKMAGRFLQRNIGKEISDLTNLWHNFENLKPPFFENVNDWIKANKN